MRNILTAIITSRSSFQVRNNRIYHNIGNPSVNPYLRNSFREYQNYSIKNDISNQSECFPPPLTICLENILIIFYFR